MARNVFISFRYSDGHKFKEELADLFKDSEDTVDYSEDIDRSHMSEETIKSYLYGKLKQSSVTIVLLTPNAINYQRNGLGKIDDWIYDEVRYSLEDRDNNATNGLIGVYVPEAENSLFQRTIHKCSVCNKESEVLSMLDLDNLVRKNMMNVKPEYKNNKCPNVYDCDYDSYCSLVSFEEFKKNFGKYVDQAAEKRNQIYKYTLKKRIEE